jgi:hypothetical protein
MRRTLFAGAILSSLVFVMLFSASALVASKDDHGKHGGDKHDRGDKHARDDKHDGGDKHGRDGHDSDKHAERHDNGNHKGWDNPHNPHNANWDYDHDRIQPGRRYPHGHYEHVKQHYILRGFDVRTRNIVLYDRSNWVVATYDVPHCHDWNWDRDDVYVYDDDHHAGWYLLFNARLGRSVHVEFSGVR